MTSPAQRFLDHLDQVSGGVEPQFFPIESTHDAMPRLTVLVYTDLPEPGMLTAITYGLSEAHHSDWRYSRPELCLSVQSTDLDWAFAVGELAEAQRGDNPFTYGTTIGFGAPIASDTQLRNLVVFAPAVLERDDYLNIDVGTDLPVTINGVYAIHDSERDYLDEHGLEAFWSLDWDPYDVARAPAV